MLSEHQKDEIRNGISFLEDFALFITVSDEAEEGTEEWDYFDSAENNLYGAISDLYELLRF